MRRRVSSQAGFSLAETMVALFILSLVSAAGSGLLFGATSTSRQLGERDGIVRQIDLAQAMIRNDLSELSPRGIQPDDGFGRVGNLFGQPRAGDGEVLSFVRSGWINPAGFSQRSDLQAVRYEIDRGDLIRIASLRPDRVNSTPETRRVLLSGVVQVNTRFQRGGVWSPDWIGDAGQALSVLPNLIELDIRFEDETSLRIVALAGQIS